jgi:peptide/nickel transport system permease protein
VRRPLVRYLIVRAFSAAALVFLVASGALLLAETAPGDYASQFGRDPASIAAERHRLGLDRSLAAQYGAWLSRSIRLDLGESFQYRRPVLTLVRERARNTAILSVAALSLATCLGVPWGLFTGSRGGGGAAVLLSVASLVLLSMPPLITSMLLLTVAARTGWLPVGGMGTAQHLIIPSIALGLPLAAAIERLQSQALRDALQRPSMRAALARGVPRSRVVTRHAWRLSVGPLLGVYGVLVGSVFSGSFAVELVTSWPGLADLMRQALMSRDTYLVAGCAAAGALFLALAIFAADLAHAAIDPRVRTDAGW